MPLSRREIRTRATRFVKHWATAHNEHADAKPFWHEFFEVFGVRGRTVGSFELHVKKLNPGSRPGQAADGYIDYPAAGADLRSVPNIRSRDHCPAHIVVAGTLLQESPGMT